MSRSLASYPEHQRTSVALRRAGNSVHGIGFWGAIDYIDKKGLPRPGLMGLAQVINKVQERNQYGENHAAAARIGRHPSDNLDRKDGRGKPPRRGNKPAFSAIRHRNTPRMAV